MNLLAEIDRWGADDPDRLAHLSGGHALTYGELARRSDALASYLAQALPDDRSPVPVIGHKQPEMLIAFLAAVKAGHPYVPIDDGLPAQRIEQILAAASAPLTLTPARVAELSELVGTSTPAPPPRLGADDPFYIIFTSGSTGVPKGVVITLGCLTSFVEWMLGEQRFERGGEAFLNQAPFSFDLSVMDLYLSLVTGGALVSISRDEVACPRRLFQALAGSGVTTWVSTPSFAQLCLAEPSFDARMLPRVRRFLFCGETLAADVAARLIERFPEAAVWNTYGPTEATVATSSVRVDRELLARYAPLPVGYPMPGTRLLTVDEHGQAAPAGQRGEIVICGPNVSPGYLGRPDLTARSFFMLDGARAYRTGDWGHFQDGLLFWDGRIDSQIKLHGYRIELGDVEAHIQSLAGVRDAVVVPRLKGGVPDALVAFVILDCAGAGPARPSSRELTAALAERLPFYMIPRSYRFLDTFPMTPNGKADRRRLAESLA
jgi:D-alanine--poly(phosphoribitol) ligase subunit 1